ncbi:hypothetical protein TRFO_07618 [Tritrichomonas foetus]|uniref:USP domain-containing protein n=1 Tax=Tritrichomonas foetus TaxID=1144522 RepID=A0A1J4JQH4_9EUKA|nr:hypothetical protein TRFO_07618 [Tritrichomonas foetus]|eukprot:OHT01369.1 hypothetical protein TRFO_07618 [Tritrichomonas foetus]
MAVFICEKICIYDTQKYSFFLSHILFHEMSDTVQDFRKWTKDFISFLGKGNYAQFSTFLPTIEAMIDDYMENFTLLPPNEDHTLEFLYEFIPEAVSLLLRVVSLKQSELENVINFFIKISLLCLFQIDQSDFKLNKTLKNIFNSEKYMYKQPKGQQFLLLCQLFVSYDCYQRLIDRCESTLPHLKHIALLFSIRKKIDPYLTLEFSEALSVLPIFIQQLQGESLRNIESVKIKQTFTKYIYPYISPTSKIDFTPLFKFSEHLIRTPYLDKQLAGIEILSTYLTKSETKNECFKTWIKDNAKFLNYIIDNDFHVEFIKSTKVFFKSLSTFHLLTLEMINKMYGNSCKMNKEERTHMYDIIISNLSTYKRDDILSFIKKPNIDPVILTFFFNDIQFYQNKENRKIIQLCISTLFKLNAQNEILKVLNPTTREIILKEALHFEEKYNLDMIFAVLSKLIQTSQYTSKEFGGNFIQTILNNYLLSTTFSFSILTEYYKKTKTSLDIKEFTIIYEIQNDDFWNFLSNLMKNNPNRPMTPIVYDSLTQIIESYDFSNASPSFITFLRYFLISKSYQQSYLMGHSINFDTFAFRRFPKLYVPILIKLLFCSKEKEMSSDLLLEFCTKFDPKQQPINEIYMIFRDHLIPKLKDKLSNTEFYIIDFIYKVLYKLENDLILEDYGKRRQCELHEKACELILHFKDSKDNILIHSSLDISCDDLLKRIRFISNNPKASAKYLNIEIKGDIPLKNKSIENKSDIFVSDTISFTKKPQILSILLSETDFPNHLFTILKTNSNDEKLLKATWILLQFLPSISKLNINISESENDYVLAYYLQVLNSNSSFEHFDSLKQIFISRKYQKSDCEVIETFLHFFDKKTAKSFKAIATPLFECINGKDQKLRKLAIKLLSKITQLNSHSPKILQIHLESVIEMFVNSNNETGKKIYKISMNLENKIPLFTGLLQKIPFTKGNEVLLFNAIYRIWEKLIDSNDDDSEDEENEKTKQNGCEIPFELLVEKCIVLANHHNIKIQWLCEMISHASSQIPEKSKIQKKINDFYSVLINRFYIQDDTSIVYSLISYAKKNHYLDDKFYEIFMKPNMHFNMSMTKYPKTDFPGLENLGATCFISSIIQPLFYILPLRKVSIENSNILKNIFLDMMVTQKGFAKMKTFVEQFNDVIDTNRQQDCVEFFLILAERISKEANLFFRGFLSNHYDDCVVNNEEFYSLSVNVKGIECLEESLKVLFDHSIINDKQKYMKITQLPPVLAIHLKRFEYNLKANAKTKISSKFTFPFEIDITPYCVNRSNPKNHGQYQLYAVVLHNGHADGGHYTAVVNINGKWIEFNDKKSHEITIEELKNMSYGSQDPKKAYDRSAYVLLYKQVNNKSKNELNEEIDFLPYISKIERKEHLCLYDENIKKFALNANIKIAISYFFNIYCHSTFTDAAEVVLKLTKTINESGYESELFDFLAKNDSQFIEIFLRSKSNLIIGNLRNFILSYQTYTKNERLFKFLDNLLNKNKLNAFVSRPEKFDTIAHLFLNYVLNNTETPIQENWGQKLCEIIEFFAKSIPESRHQNIRLIDFLKTIKLLNIIKSEKSFEILEKNIKFITANPFNSFALLELYESRPILQLLKTSELLLNFIIGLVECGAPNEQIEPFMIAAVKKYDISNSFKSFLRSSPTLSCNLPTFILQNYEKYILPELLSPKNDIRLKAEHLTYDLFVEVKPPRNIPQYSNSKSSNSKKPSEKLMNFAEKSNSLIDEAIKIKRYDIYILESFLRVLKWIVKRTQIPFVEKCLELYTMINSKNSNKNPDKNYLRLMEVFKVMNLKNIKIVENNITSENNKINNGVRDSENCKDSENSKNSENLEGKKKLLYVDDVIENSLRFGKHDNLNQSIFKLLENIEDIERLKKIYQTTKFVEFFEKQNEIRQDIFLFEKLYKPTFTKVLPVSKIYQKKSLEIIEKAISFEKEQPLTSFLCESIYEKLPETFILNVNKWIFECFQRNLKALNYHYVVIYMVKSMHDSKRVVNTEVLFTDNKLQSVFQKMKNQCILTTKEKNIMFKWIIELIKNSSSLIIELTEILFQFISNITENNCLEYNIFINWYFHTIATFKKFDHVDNFMMNVFPHLKISYWLELPLMDFLRNNFKNVEKSLDIVAKEVLLNTCVYYPNRKNYLFLQNYLNVTKTEKIEEMLSEIYKGNESNKILVSNLDKIAQIKPELSNFIKFLKKKK